MITQYGIHPHTVVHSMHYNNNSPISAGLASSQSSKLSPVQLLHCPLLFNTSTCPVHHHHLFCDIKQLVHT